MYMNKRIFRSAWDGVSKALKKHSPEILTGIGIIGMIATTVTAVQATPKALRLIDEREIKENKRLNAAEIVKTTWKCYIPAAVTGTLSIACLIGSSAVNTNRNAALATAYTISEAALREYQDKTLEVVGVKKEQAIRDAVAKEQLERARIEEHDVVFTSGGETLCYDPLTDRCFKSDIETLRRAENTLNKRMRDEICITLNDFFAEIGLDACDSAVGDQLGWDIDKGYIELYFSAQLDKHGVPCLVLGHRNPPQYLC